MPVYRIAPLILLAVTAGCAPRHAPPPGDRTARDVKAVQFVCVVRIKSVGDFHQETGLAGVWTGQLNRAVVERWLKGSAKAKEVLFLTPGARDYLDPGEKQLIAKEKARMPKAGERYVVLLVKRHPNWYETFKPTATLGWHKADSSQARRIELLLAGPPKSK